MKEVIKIMIADDFRILLEDLKEIINATENMEVVGVASSGKEAVSIARESPFDQGNKA